MIRVRQPEKQQWRKVQNQLLYAFNNMSAKFELLLQSRSEVNRANLENVIWVYHHILGFLQTINCRKMMIWTPLKNSNYHRTEDNKEIGIEQIGKVFAKVLMRVYIRGIQRKIAWKDPRSVFLVTMALKISFPGSAGQKNSLDCTESKIIWRSNLLVFIWNAQIWFNMLQGDQGIPIWKKLKEAMNLQFGPSE